MSHHGCPERLSSRAKGFGDESGNQTMEVLVETLTGTAFEMTVSPSDTVLAIKSKIFRVEGIPVSQQHLLYNHQELEDSCTLAACGVGGGARLRLVLGLRGGPVATRRLPPPRLTDRDEEWILGCGGGGAHCRVAVLVLNDGRRVNMLRVRRSKDKSSSLPHLAQSTEPQPSTSAPRDDHHNAVTMHKMAALRQRLDRLSLRRPNARNDDVGEGIQKTRSEEMLSTVSHPSFNESDDTDTLQLCDGNYTRYHYECTHPDRAVYYEDGGYSVWPATTLGARADSAQSVAPDDVHAAQLAPHILVKGHHEADEEAAILEECLDGVDEASLASHYGQLWVSSSWRSASSLTAQRPAPPPPAPTLQDLLFSTSTPDLDNLQRNRYASLWASPPPPAPTLQDLLFSSSTPDLDNLQRNRILPALSRHRNREHLDLSDEGLDLRNAAGDTTAPAGESTAAAATGAGESIDSGERRQARIEKITEMNSLYYSNVQNRYLKIPPTAEPSPEPQLDTRTPCTELPAQLEVEVKTVVKPNEGAAKIEKKVRIRCGFCRKRLSIATVHRCRCGAEFCAPHRYAEVHGCAYDYKASGVVYLQRANPLVSAPKLPKI